MKAVGSFVLRFRNNSWRQFSYESMGERYRELLDTVQPCVRSVTSSLKGKTVLVDMDNTLVDWDGEFILRYGQQVGRDVGEQVRSRKSFEIEDAAMCSNVVGAWWLEASRKSVDTRETWLDTLQNAEFCWFYRPARLVSDAI